MLNEKTKEDGKNIYLISKEYLCSEEVEGGKGEEVIWY